MRSRASKSHSFVVKIWTEEVRDPSRDAAWRGSITHVETGERQYVDRLPQVVSVLAPFVEQMGAPLDWTTRLITRWVRPHATLPPKSPDDPA